MRFSLHLGASQLTLLSLAFLGPALWTAASYPTASYPASSYPASPTMGGPELKSALLHLQAALEDPGDDDLVWPEAWAAEWPPVPRPTLPEDGEEEEHEEGGSWEGEEEEALLRAQRGELHYQEGGDGEDGLKRNKALTSIAGGLQAVSREKGGFGFRFGRKRWSDGGRSDGGRREGGAGEGA